MYPDLRCNEVMADIAPVHGQCRNEENHDVIGVRARELCVIRIDEESAARHRFHAAFAAALEAKRRQNEAEASAREIERSRDLSNSMMDGFSGQRVRRRDFDRMDERLQAAQRDVGQARFDREAADAAAADRATERDRHNHSRFCDLCCFRVHCTDCGITFNK